MRSLKAAERRYAAELAAARRDPAPSRLAYRVEVRGLDNYAQAGPRAVIVVNHVSFLDALLLRCQRLSLGRDAATFSPELIDPAPERRLADIQ